MNVRKIVTEWLKAHGYDGLCCDRCGCGLGDLMPCHDEYAGDCVPAYKGVCADGDQIFTEEKPEGKLI